MALQTVTLSVVEASNLAKSVLEKTSLTKEDGTIILEHLLAAEARGYSSHGLMRLPALVKAVKSSPSAGPRLLKVDDPAFLFMDAQGTQGIAAVTSLLKAGADRVAKGTVVAVAATNYVGTTGSLGVYGAECAKQGLVAIQFCHSEYGVAPYGTAEAILGTNPISISIPGSSFPFVADFATSAWSYGDLKRAAERGERVPEGVVQTAAGKPSTNPRDADDGSQLPMAGHKGYALGLAIELICGPILGGKAGRAAVAGSDSYFSLLFRADVVRSSGLVDRDMSALYGEIKGAPLAKGFNEVRIPGEAASKKAASFGEVVISKRLRDELLELAGQ